MYAHSEHVKFMRVNILPSFIENRAHTHIEREKSGFQMVIFRLFFSISIRLKFESESTLATFHAKK